MRVFVNGEPREIAEETTLQHLLEELRIEEKVMAAAINTKIVKKEEWGQRVLQKHDRLELLHFVGGG